VPRRLLRVAARDGRTCYHRRVKRVALVLALVVGAFVAACFHGADGRGVIAEEVQPFLASHPVVLERIPPERRDAAWSAAAPHVSREPPAIAPMPPYEPGAPADPRWVSTSVWPMVAYRGESRTWPVFVRGHQTALGVYLALGLSLVLGEPPGSWRRATTVLAALALVLTFLLARRYLARRDALYAVAVLGLSWGMIVIGRSAYACEVGSRLFLLATFLALAHRRWLAAGLLGAVAVLMRAPVLTVLLPGAVVLWRNANLAEPDHARIRHLALVTALALLAPLVVVLGLDSLAPFRADAAPLATLGDPLAALPRIPRQALLSLAWLGDANSVWRPLVRGELGLDRSLLLPALLTAAPTLGALVRMVRRQAHLFERLYVVCLASCVVAGAWFYPDPDQFQLALALEPLFALCLVAQLAALAPLARRWAPLVAGLLLAWRGATAVAGFASDDEVAVAFLSGATQSAALDALAEVDPDGAHTVTTTYLHVGVPEARRGMRPLHAWPLFSGTFDTDHADAWRELLCAYAPRHVLHTTRRSLFESDDMFPEAIARGAPEVLSELDIDRELQRFPTESGAPGWELWTLRYPEGFTCDPPERPATPARWRDLEVGTRIGAHRIVALRPREDGGVALHFEDALVLDLAAPDPEREPPAEVPGFAVLYRRAPGVSDGELVERAVSFADALRARWSRSDTATSSP